MPPRIEDTRPFFLSFTKNATPPKRGEFETREEYAKRLPPPFDSKKVLFFRLAADLPLGKGYSYDIDTGKLTFSGGGRLLVGGYDKNQPAGSITVVIDEEFRHPPDTQAKNAFGATITVSHLVAIYYAFRFFNINDFPNNVFDAKEAKFRITIERPRGEAERLAKSAVILLAVSIDGYQDSLSDLIFSKEPTFTSPRDYMVFLERIDARLVKVLLYDRENDKILAEYPVAKK